MQSQFYNLTGGDVLAQFHTDATRGLTTGEVHQRLEKYGPNELTAKKQINPFILFLGQFKSFIIYILIFAVTISLISGEYTDASVIMVILLFNAFFGFLQEYKAEKAIEALKKLAGLKARVLRNGKIVNVESKELVPGDILILEEGTKLPADARILEETLLAVSEASLTGESVPVSKHANAIQGDLPLADRKNMLFSGTVITRGKAKAIVTETGMQSEIGKIAGMISETETELTPLQKKLESLGKWIGVATIIICIIVFIVGVLKDGLLPLLFSGQIVEFIFAAKEWFLTAVSLAVAAVPEGLPAIVTIALAIGVRSMVRRNALIRRLPSVETLGETTVICSDKTGTITMNQMTVRVAYVDGQEVEISGEGYELEGNLTINGRRPEKKQVTGIEQLFRIGMLCNDASLDQSGERVAITGDPTEAALLVSSEKAGVKLATSHAWKRVGEEPFDAVRKMMSTINQDPEGKKYVFTKGAPERLLEKCTKILLHGKVVKLTPKEKKAILEKNKIFAKRALRVLGFAYKMAKGKHESDLIFVGLQGMIDPPRKEIVGAVARCKSAGIRVIMITGDNRYTAAAIAHEVGIEGESIDGIDFSKLSEEEQLTALDRIHIFSRVEPGHKMTIVKLLQEKGEVVAMTGDGVNDAPAIKKADLGIAMGITGTDVAKEASDMVLMDDNFTSIVNAVEEGRGIYINIQKFVNYLLSCNLGEVFVIFLAILLGWPLPMTAIMLLWLNLVTDGLPALALSVDPNPKNLMEQPPKKNEGIMDNSMKFNIIYVSILITFGVLGIFAWGMLEYQNLQGDIFLEKIQTLAFTAIIVLELVRLQAIRSEHKLALFSNKYLVLAVAISIGLQLLVIYTPLSKFFGTQLLNGLDWLYIILMSAVIFVLNKLGMALKHHFHWFEDT